MSPTINDLYADVAGSGYVTTSVPGDADVLGIVPETGQPFSGGWSKYGIQSTDGQAIFHVLVIGFCNQLPWFWRMLTCFLFTSMLQQYSGFAFGQVIVWCGQPSLAWQTCHPIIGLNTVKAWRLGGGFHFFFTPSLGKLFNLLKACWNMLKPPTRRGFWFLPSVFVGLLPVFPSAIPTQLQFFPFSRYDGFHHCREPHVHGA